MIGKLTGTIDSVGEDTLILDVGGVGYVVHGSSRMLAGLSPEAGSTGRPEPVSLFIETHVREDHIHLYGFRTEAEKAWFLRLTSVQGVGGRVGLAILSVLGPEDLSAAIALQDKAAVARANGVGPKLAQRIVTELKDKALPEAMGVPVGAKASSASPENAAVNEAISALVNLGYGLSEAGRAVHAAASADEGPAPVESLIRQGLKELAR